MLENHQLYPLEVNSSTGEPFLRLKGHPSIIITPPRIDDVALYSGIMNDPRIYEWLGSPPFPYLPEHAEAWYQRIKESSDKSLSELQAAKDISELIFVGSSPIRTIREVKEDGSELYLGDIGIFRVTDGKFLVPPSEDVNEETKAKYKEFNDARPVGDPAIAWTIGYHHGRGIMTDAVRTLMQDWAIPRMGVRHVMGSAFEGNRGSLRVFEKNEFLETRFIENHVELKGRWRNLHVVEWKWRS
ncbi:hypothetical protein H0H93_005736 [Arthromyces matolae]|nr:hypothetical protein H0H93_005736 [Arthromyces matolae]